MYVYVGYRLTVWFFKNLIYVFVDNINGWLYDQMFISKEVEKSMAYYNYN